MDYFLNFSGSFEKKVAQMMKLMKDTSVTYELFKQEITNNTTKINESYTYVEWIYVHDDAEETLRFENGLETYEEGSC